MPFIAGHVPPFMVLLRVQYNHAVLFPRDVIGLPRIPMGVIELDEVSLPAPSERVFMVKIVSACP